MLSYHLPQTSKSRRNSKSTRQSLSAAVLCVTVLEKKSMHCTEKCLWGSAPFTLRAYLHRLRQDHLHVAECWNPEDFQNVVLMHRACRIHHSVYARTLEDLDVQTSLQAVRGLNSGELLRVYNQGPATPGKGLMYLKYPVLNLTSELNPQP